MTNIASESRSANIVRDHAMILPDDATPQADGIFGNDRARERLRNKTGEVLSVTHYLLKCTPAQQM
jgi:hypothetical protein